MYSKQHIFQKESVGADEWGPVSDTGGCCQEGHLVVRIAESCCTIE